MKIAFLGFPKFIRELLFNLKDTSFLINNEIDILFAEKRKYKLSYYFKKISLGKAVYLKDSFIYKKQISEFIMENFPDKDISFIQKYKNIKVVDYNGLENIKNIESYDFIIAATFSGKIPTKIINKPKNKILNIHASFLPELRGGYPTYIGAYLNTLSSGVSIHFMNDLWDAGPILIQKKISVSSNTTNYDRIILAAQHAAELVNELFSPGFNINPVEQNNSEASHCYKILKAKREIKEMLASESLEGFVRANFSKYLFPFTFCTYRLHTFSIIKISLAPNILPEKYYNRKNKIIKFRGEYYINYYEKTYRIVQYFYKGKLHHSSVK